MASGKRRGLLAVIAFMCAVLCSGGGNFFYTHAEELLAAGMTCENGEYRYREYEDYICISGYLGNEDTLVIPEKIDGKTVRKLEDGVFRGCRNLTGVKIANTVESIGSYAFADSSVCDLTLPAREEIVIYENTLYNEAQSMNLHIPGEVQRIHIVSSETGNDLDSDSYSLNDRNNLAKPLIVYGPEGSYAQTFAGQWGLSFIREETVKHAGNKKTSSGLSAVLGDETEKEKVAGAETHITKEMVEECMQIGTDLQKYVDEQKLEEGESETALQAVCDWLKNDRRVLFAEINEQCVLYSSVDHVAGLYEFPPEEGYFGSMEDDEEAAASESEGDAESESEEAGSASFEECSAIAEAYTYYLENGELREQGDEEKGIVYFDGLNSITNEKFLLLSTETDDMIRNMRNQFTPMAERYEKELGYEASIVTGAQEKGEILFSKQSLDQYGIVVLITHSGYFRRSDGSYMVFGNIGIAGNRIIDIMYEIDTSIAPGDANYDLFYVNRDENQPNWDHTVLYVSGNNTYMTSNYYMHFYEDRHFDNTIFFFGGCNYGRDTILIDFLLEHGAKAVVSFGSSVAEGLMLSCYENLFGTLLKTEKQNRKNMKDVTGFHIFVLMSSVFNRISNTFQTDWDWDTFSEDLGSFYPIMCTAAENFSLEHYGTLSGNVKLRTNSVTVTKDGQEKQKERYDDCEAADLYFYRFVNQAFDAGDTMKVSVNNGGIFQAENLRWGVYAVQLTGEEVTDTVTGVVLGDDTFHGGTIVADKWGTAASASVAMETNGTRNYISGAEINLTLESADMEAETSYVGNTYTFTTGKDGAFRADHLPAGTYRMQIQAEEGQYSGTFHWENGTDYDYEAPFLLEVPDYYTFIRDELLPEYGWASLEDATCEITRNTYQMQKGWDQRSGIVGADIVDMNMDGIDELLVYFMSEEKNETDDSPYTEFGIRLYTTEDGVIVEKADVANVTPLSDSALDRLNAGIMNLNGKNFLYVERESKEYFANGSDIHYIWVEYRDNGFFADRYFVGKTDGGSSDIAYSVLIWSEDDTKEERNGIKLPIWEEYPGCAGSADAPAMLENEGWKPDLGNIIMERGFQEIPGLSLNDIPGEEGSYPSYDGTPALKESFMYYSRGDRDTEGASMCVSLHDETGLREKIAELDAAGNE